MQRSTSAASLREDEEETSGRDGEQVGNPGASVAPSRMLARKPVPMNFPGRSVVDAMSAEIDRADCREMVRDITFATLPTRQSFINGTKTVVAAEARAPIAEEEEEEEPVHPDFAVARPAATQALNRHAPAAANANGTTTSTPHGSPPRKAAGGLGAGGPMRPPDDSSPDSSPEGKASSAVRRQHRSPQHAPAPARSSPGGYAANYEDRGLADEWGGDAESRWSGAESGNAEQEAHAVAIQAAIVANRADMVETLLVGADPDANPDSRADANCVLATGKTPLGLSASMGLYDISAALLSAGADPSLRDRNGDTPLHLASLRGHVALARLLLDAGAVPGSLDSRGQTALQLARSAQMQTLLKAADAGDALPPRLEGEEEDDDEGSNEEEDDGAGCGVGAGSTAKSGRNGTGGSVLADSNGNHGARGGKAGVEAAAAEAATAGSGGVSAAQASSSSSGGGGAASGVAFGPPPVPADSLGDPSCLPGKLGVYDLLRELQPLLNAPGETDLKRLLVLPHGLQREVQCDVVRVGKGNTYRCYLRLPGSGTGAQERRVCIFEATRSRKGKLKNSQYRILLPKGDARMIPAEYGPPSEMSDEALDAALYCGKVRSYNLSGANFVAYDDGVKEPWTVKEGKQASSLPEGVRLRRQLVAMVFNKSTSRRVPMTMRMLMPTPEAPDTPPSVLEENRTVDLLETLQSIPQDGGNEAPPAGTHLLKLVPPRWNADEQMFQLFCEGRACCMSNKNVQLADTARPDEAALQVGKLRGNMFNVDMAGCVSPFQAFAAALAVFDQSSVRRRF